MTGYQPHCFRHQLCEMQLANLVCSESCRSARSVHAHSPTVDWVHLRGRSQVKNLDLLHDNCSIVNKLDSGVVGDAALGNDYSFVLVHPVGSRLLGTRTVSKLVHVSYLHRFQENLHTEVCLLDTALEHHVSCSACMCALHYQTDS